MRAEVDRELLEDGYLHLEILKVTLVEEVSEVAEAEADTLCDGLRSVPA